MTEDYVLQTDLNNIEELRKVWKEAGEIVPKKFNPQHFCDDYEENTISKDLYDGLVEYYKLDWGPWDDNGGESFYMDKDDMMEIVIAFFKVGNPDMSLEILDIPSFSTHGGVGYGLFCM